MAQATLLGTYSGFVNKSGVPGRDGQLVTGGNYKTPIVSHGNRLYVVHCTRPFDQGSERGPVGPSGGTNAVVWIRVYDRDSGKELASKSFSHVVNDWNLPPWGIGFQYDTTHHGFALGIDTRGFLHAAGRMHRTPQQWVVPPGHKDAEEYRHAWQYWRSDAPLSPNQLTAPVMEFRGERVRVSGNSIDTRNAPPGVMISYADFFTDQSGELFIKSRVSIGNYGHETAIGVSRYNVSSERWEPIGGTNHRFGKLRFVHARWGVPGGKYFESEAETPNLSEPKVLIWNDTGAEVPQAPNYQAGYLCLHADVRNRIHMAAAIADGRTVKPAGNRPVAAWIIYAYSDDGMRTWRRTDGSEVTRLPMTATGHPDSVPDIAVGPQWLRGNKAEFWHTVGVTHLGWGINGQAGAPFVSMARAGGGKNWIACYDPYAKTWRDPIEIRLRGKSITSTQCYLQCDNTGHLILPWGDGTFYRGKVNLQRQGIDWSTTLSVPGMDGFPDTVDPVELRRTGDIFVRTESAGSHKVFAIRQNLKNYPTFRDTPTRGDRVTISIES